MMGLSFFVSFPSEVIVRRRRAFACFVTDHPGERHPSYRRRHLNIDNHGSRRGATQETAVNASGRGIVIR